MVALSPLVNGGWYSRIRLLAPSSTQRFPLGSKVRLQGPKRFLFVGELQVIGVEVKSVWPITTLAFSPLENGGLNSSTRLLPSSAIHRFPALSEATSAGKHNPLCVIWQTGFGFEKSN